MRFFLSHDNEPIARLHCISLTIVNNRSGANHQSGASQVNEQRILEELLALLEASGVTIRNEPLGGSGGGLCTIKGENVFFVDTQAASADAAAICADAVLRLLDIDKIYIRPEIRQFIENHSS